MKSVSAVVFDFNGTLFFDYRENKDAWNEISMRYRGRVFRDDEYDSMMGMTDPMCVKKIVGNVGADEIKRISDEKEDIYFSLCLERGLKIENDALSFIDRLKKDNIKILIASSAPKKNMEWYKKNLNLLDYFSPSFIIAGRDDLPSKPESDIFRLALTTASVDGSNAICFEDSPNGLIAAINTPFGKTYCISSPGFDDRVQKTLAPVITWGYTLDNYEDVITIAD